MAWPLSHGVWFLISNVTFCHQTLITCKCCRLIWTKSMWFQHTLNVRCISGNWLFKNITKQKASTSMKIAILCHVYLGHDICNFKIINKCAINHTQLSVHWNTRLEMHSGLGSKICANFMPRTNQKWLSAQSSQCHEQTKNGLAHRRHSGISETHNLLAVF